MASIDGSGGRGGAGERGGGGGLAAAGRADGCGAGRRRRRHAETAGSADGAGLAGRGLVTLSRFGEWLLAGSVLRYRPAPGTWLEVEVRRLLPGRRVDVYVAPKTSGVFALGGHTIGLGEASIGAGGPTPALIVATGRHGGITSPGVSPSR